MNSAHPNPTTGRATGSGLSLDDIYYTVFRHHKLILSFVALGILASLALRVVRPPLYESKAKLMVLYVVDAKGVSPGNSVDQVRPIDPGGLALINAEIEILTSLDVAAQAADKAGPERILAKLGGGNDRMQAAGAISTGLSVEPPRTQILTVTFKHRDPQLVQPILRALIEAYQEKHLQVHRGIGVLDEYYARQRDELGKDLARTEEELKRLKTEANVVSIEDTKHAYQNQINKWQEELLAAEAELAQRKAFLGDVAKDALQAGLTNGSTASVPSDKVDDYSFMCSELENLKKRERELALKYKEAYPLLQGVRSQIATLNQAKSNLAQQFPALAQLGVGVLRSGTNATGTDLAVELGEIRRLTAKVDVLNQFMTNLQAKVSRVMEFEPQINKIQRQRDLNETNYQIVVANLREARMGEALAAGKVINMNVLQEPSPPRLDYKKLLKLVAVALGGCVAAGFGLAFVIDLALDRTIRRRSDIERHLRLPVFLAIPDTTWTPRFRWNWFRNGKTSTSTALTVGSNGNEDTALAPWDPSHHLQLYTEGLRERVMTFFEVNNMNLKKPKLVAVTGCNEGSGVSTLASGLAASLSKTGDGNVLLVDMNGNQGMAHSFYKGKPGCGLTDVLEPESRSGAQVQEKLFLAAIGHSANDKLTKVEPTRFSQMVPKLKASDYDYIIFDMPPVSQTSVTPRLASHMDIVLLVLESEKTGEQAAARASALMRESRSNVAAVLNKYRQHVPERLSQEL